MILRAHVCFRNRHIPAERSATISRRAIPEAAFPSGYWPAPLVGRTLKPRLHQTCGSSLGRMEKTFSALIFYHLCFGNMITPPGPPPPSPKTPKNFDLV